MAVDSTAMADLSVTQDTATDSPAALDTEPTAGESAVAESPEIGDDASAEPTPDQSDEDGSAEDQGEDDTAVESGQTESERKLTRSQRQALRQQEAIDKAVAAKLAEYQAAQERAAQQQRIAEQSTAEAQAQARELAEFLGEPDEPGKPGTISRLRSEIDAINAKIKAELVTPQGIDIDALLADEQAKQAELASFERNNAMRDKLVAQMFGDWKADFIAVAEFPEFEGDPQKQARYLHAQGGVLGAMHVLADTIRGHKDAEWSAKFAASEKASADKLAAALADRDAWRIRAGGGSLPNTAGGAATPGRSISDRLIQEAGSVDAFIERAKRGDYARLDLTR